jgi:hypothetical protein
MRNNKEGFKQEDEMRDKRLGIVCTVLLVVIYFLCGCQPVIAAEGAISIESLKIGGKAIGDRVKKTLFYKQLLPGGKISVNGKAISKEGALVSVEVTQDGKKTWRKARLSQNGFFEYSFTPRADESYVVCIKATSAKGLASIIEATCTEVKVSEKNIRSLVKETLDEVVQAYERNDSRAFMSFFSEDFYGDKDILDRAVRSGASLYHDVDIRVTLNSVVPDHGDKIFASMAFNRRYTVIKTGKTTTDSGATSFIFGIENGQLKIINMAKPPLFLY